MNPESLKAPILDCLRLESSASKASRLEKFSPADWEAVLRQARQHGVSALAYSRLRESDCETLAPPEARQALRNSLLSSASRNLLLYRELGQALEALQAASVDVIALKGTHLAEIVYGDIALRPMGDIDLMVRQDELHQAVSALLSLGYTPCRSFQIEKEIQSHHHLPPYLKKGAHSIELHWHIADPGLPVKIEVEELWGRSRTAWIAGKQTRVLSPEDLLLHLCLHQCGHRLWLGLKACCDIAQTLAFYQAGLDWERTSERAAAWGLGRGLFLALHLAVELLNAPVPAGILDRLRPADFTLEVALLARRRVLRMGEPEEFHPDLVRLWGDEGGRAKLVSIRKIAFPPRELLARRYSLPPGSKKAVLYYPVRLKEVLQEGGGQAWRLLRGEPGVAALRRNENLLNEWWKG